MATRDKQKAVNHLRKTAKRTIILQAKSYAQWFFAISSDLNVAMSSFFTLPASQRKRKRTEPSSATKPRREPTNTQRTPKKRRELRDESISGSESGEDFEDAVSHHNQGSESSKSDEDEDVAGRRTRLAEQYLENTRNEVLAEGFDAKDIDNELLAQRMGDRLKEDTAESKGKLYRWIADDYDFAGARHAQFRADTQAVTGAATCFPYVYTVAKDLTLIKWELPSKALADTQINGNGPTPAGQSRKPKKLLYTRGNGKKAYDPTYQHHTSDILCVAASGDGKFVVTGGRDKKLIVWNAEDLKPLKVFAMHRDAVTSVCFRRGTNQLFSASKDRTVKIWSLDELAYVETLYGHQDEVLDVGALNEEKCVTVGARDRTARYWRVVEESQLVFRGGGGGKRRKEDDGAPEQKSYNEGSIDRVTMVDDEMFVTGSDNGSLSLWNIQKKKAIFTYPLAHGIQPPLKPEEASAEMYPKPDAVGEPQPRWITALGCLPFSNIVFSGSWDGDIKAWKISEDKRRLEPLGSLGSGEHTNGALTNGNSAMAGVDGDMDAEVRSAKTVKGVVNDISVFERAGEGKEGLGVVAVMGKEHRLGRWLRAEGKNYAVVFEPLRRLS